MPRDKPFGSTIVKIVKPYDMNFCSTNSEEWDCHIPPRLWTVKGLLKLRQFYASTLMSKIGMVVELWCPLRNHKVLMCPDKNIHYKNVSERRRIFLRKLSDPPTAIVIFRRKPPRRRLPPLPLLRERRTSPISHHHEENVAEPHCYFDDTLTLFPFSCSSAIAAVPLLLMQQGVCEHIMKLWDIAVQLKALKRNEELVQELGSALLKEGARCFFYKKKGHMKKEWPKFKAWLEKKDLETASFLNQKAQIQAALAGSQSKKSIKGKLKQILHLLQEDEELLPNEESDQEDNPNEDDCFGINLDDD
ncbi:hypothetical protein PIB30_043995 [Stylosanthes scabra]|uniref:Uncharacterized protein n=1 Tax=Stylosanthes scabra TaxID=79078 RepID=A0ABU6VFQ3_9FABA|nr:hypothetical protein [Stylosanthes scabra]